MKNQEQTINNSNLNNNDETQTAKLADLAVTEEQEEQVKGGLPAVQKVREAAARISS